MNEWLTRLRSEGFRFAYRWGLFLIHAEAPPPFRAFSTTPWWGVKKTKTGWTRSTHSLHSRSRRDRLLRLSAEDNHGGLSLQNHHIPTFPIEFDPKPCSSPPKHLNIPFKWHNTFNIYLYISYFCRYYQFIPLVSYIKWCIMFSGYGDHQLSIWG